MTNSVYGYCSWCNQASHHHLSEQNFLRRHTYKCGACGELTVQCRCCKNMARAGKKWDDELCAEHDGTIASFGKLGLQLKDIADFETIFERESVNVLRAGKIVGGTIAGVAIFAPVAILAAPSLASALGAAGLLGAAGTGTAISTLSGAALANASLAAIGGGTMAAGTIVITAAGAALGAYQGGAVSNSYFGEVDHFDIRQLKLGSKGNKHAIIFVNGFMSQGNSETSDWTEHLQTHFPENPWYHTDWESKNLHKLGALIAKSPKLVTLEMVKNIAKKAAKNAPKKIGPLALVNQVFDLLDNPWHATMVKASMTGILLADAIARTPGWTFTLAGHSLGARVIYYALEALSTKNESVIENVYLLGGAVGGGGKDSNGWRKAVSAVSGKIYNCFSENDSVLKYLYQGANGRFSTPIGYAPITLDHPQIFDFDCTSLVDSHFKWKERFGEILTQLQDE